MPDDPRFLPMVAPRDATGPPLIFEKVAIAGLGLIGGSIALAARQIWPRGLVIGVDDKEVLEKAMLLQAIDVAADDLVVAAEADLVILAAPVRQNLDLLGRLPEYVHTPAVVTDVSSTKRAVVEGARALPDRFTFVGGHPLGGAARSGIEFARADLFEGRPWIFTPAGQTDGAALERLFAFVTALGARPLTMNAVDHDRMLAFISHLPQVTASALMHIVGEGAGDAGLALAGRGLMDTTRLASSPAAVWTDICSTNADELGQALDRLIAVLQEMRGHLDSAAVLERVFSSANHWRARLPTSSSQAGLKR
jgi:prephenate dehydrogenase